MQQNLYGFLHLRPLLMKKAFYSRRGNMLNVPAEITSTMPDDIFLDGEIWYSNCHSPNKTTNNYCMLGSGQIISKKPERSRDLRRESIGTSLNIWYMTHPSTTESIPLDTIIWVSIYLLPCTPSSNLPPPPSPSFLSISESFDWKKSHWAVPRDSPKADMPRHHPLRQVLSGRTGQGR